MSFSTAPHTETPGSSSSQARQAGRSWIIKIGGSPARARMLYTLRQLKSFSGTSMGP